MNRKRDKINTRIRIENNRNQNGVHPYDNIEKNKKQNKTELVEYGPHRTKKSM